MQGLPDKICQILVRQNAFVIDHILTLYAMAVDFGQEEEYDIAVLNIPRLFSYMIMLNAHVVRAMILCSQRYEEANSFYN